MMPTLPFATLTVTLREILPREIATSMLCHYWRIDHGLAVRHVEKEPRIALMTRI
jgi:hypothetical protein